MLIIEANFVKVKVLLEAQLVQTQVTKDLLPNDGGELMGGAHNAPPLKVNEFQRVSVNETTTLQFIISAKLKKVKLLIRRGGELQNINFGRKALNHNAGAFDRERTLLFPNQNDHPRFKRCSVSN